MKERSTSVSLSLVIIHLFIPTLQYYRQLHSRDIAKLLYESAHKLAVLPEI